MLNSSYDNQTQIEDIAMKIDITAIKFAAKLLSEGKLVAIPTETVYGLGADASNLTAVQKIYAVKKRPMTNPLIIHLSNTAAISDFAQEIPDAAFILAEKFWPGPLTLILKKRPNVLSLVTGGQDSVAVRVPSHPVALALLNEFGGGIAAPSANRYGNLSPTQSNHVKQGLGNDVDYILEGGPCKIGIESTIVSLLDDLPIILREGHISEHTIAKALGLKSLSHKMHSTVVVPGSTLKHYSPLKPLYLLDLVSLKNTLEKMMAEN